jgi:hypothetical protein
MHIDICEGLGARWNVEIEVFFDFPLSIEGGARICIRIEAHLFSIPFPIPHS